MSELTTQQIQSISNFRASNPKYTLLNDEAILSIMQKEIQEGGVVYKGLETLAASGKTPTQGGHLIGYGITK